MQLLFFISCNNGKGEVHILPDGYTGAVVIVYGVKESSPLPIVDDSYGYSIPSSGILYTSTKANTGKVSLSRLKFYYKKEDGEMEKLNGPLVRQQINMQTAKDTIKPDNIYVFSEITGIVGDIGHVYTSYIVSHPTEKDIQNEYIKIHQLILLVENAL